MLGRLKRFFSGRGSAEADRAALADWATRRGHVFRRTRGHSGFVIEGVLESRPWRLEWGPAQRNYIDGHELRFRMELDLPDDQQMLLLSKPLMDLLERRTYEEFTDSVQTQAGTGTPEEMRWLVMFPKLDLAALNGLDFRFGAVASQAAVGLAWLAGPLASLLLQEARTGLLQDDPPFVLMTLRGRVYLRMQLAEPDPARLASALGLFETAVAQAVRAAAEVTDTSVGWSTGATSAWQSLQPGTDDPNSPRRKR